MVVSGLKLLTRPIELILIQGVPYVVEDATLDVLVIVMKVYGTGVDSGVRIQVDLKVEIFELLVQELTLKIEDLRLELLDAYVHLYNLTHLQFKLQPTQVPALAVNDEIVSYGTHDSLEETQLHIANILRPFGEYLDIEYPIEISQLVDGNRVFLVDDPFGLIRVVYGLCLDLVKRKQIDFQVDVLFLHVNALDCLQLGDKLHGQVWLTYLSPERAEKKVIVGFLVFFRI